LILIPFGIKINYHNMTEFNWNWDIYNTDKNMSGHGYNLAYDRFLLLNRMNIQKVMEIGTRKGSIDLWLEYFPNCKLFGIDIIDPNYISDRFIYENINQGNISHWESFIKKHGSNFDVIIDDGPHTTPEQLISFNAMFSALKSGGMYIVEDLHCTEPYDKNYMKFRNGCDYSFLDILKEFKENKYAKNSYISNLESLKTMISEIVILKSERNRWPSFMGEPSEIVFIIKK